MKLYEKYLTEKLNDVETDIILLFKMSARGLIKNDNDFINSIVRDLEGKYKKPDIIKAVKTLMKKEYIGKQIKKPWVTSSGKTITPSNKDAYWGLLDKGRELPELKKAQREIQKSYNSLKYKGD